MVKTAFKTLALRTVIAAAATVACVGASAALPAFTFNPTAVGLTGGATFAADNLLVSDYAVVTFTSASTFTQTGFLQVTSAQLGGTSFTPGGLNSAYGLYFAFTGAGLIDTVTTSTTGTTKTSGELTSLTYTLNAYTGPGVFSPTSAPASFITLASGSLLSGDVTGTIKNGVQTGSTSSADLTFAVAPGASAFFGSPSPFYGVAQSAFTNTASQIKTTATGFEVTQGGGSINFVATPVPEPETYALMLGGLGAVGLLAMRRRSRV